MDPTPTRKPGLRLTTKWLARPGAAYGLANGALCARVEVTMPPGFDFTHFDSVFASLVDQQHDLPPRPDDSALGLLDRVLFLQSAAQRQQRVPVFVPGHVRSSRTESDGARSFDIAIPLYVADPAATAFRWARLAAAQVVEGAEAGALLPEFEACLEHLRKHALPGINNFHLLNAAHAAGIPFRPVRLDTFVFGQGARARWFASTITDRTPAFGTANARLKARTSQMLRLHGIPVPDHHFVNDEAEATAVADRLGYPVVVKPDDQEQGRGVEAGLIDAHAVVRAFRAATAHSKRILVEKHHFGEDYRVTVLNGRVVKILHRRAGGVLGDGVRSVAELVAAEQATPRLLRVLRQTGRQLIEVDDEAANLLHDQGLAVDDVPAAGRFVTLRRRNNISAGGIQTLVPVEDAHPDNVALAVRATQAIHLDLCGVDMLMPDIARSWFETGAVIIEMNAQPQIGINLAPEVYATVLHESVEGDGRVPVHLVLCAGDADVPDEAGLKAAMRENACDGVSASSGCWTTGRRLSMPFSNGFEAARSLLLDRGVHGATCVMTAAEVLDHGLPSDRLASLVVRRSATLDAQSAQRVEEALELARPHLREAAR